MTARTIYNNIFLDFLNRDSRQIYGMYNNYSHEQHIRSLCEAINVAVFLCSEYCIMPPGFFVECQIARDTLARNQEYIKDQIIRMPLKECTLDELFEKKIREYDPYKEKYSEIFNQKNLIRLKKYSQALIVRKSNVGQEILQSWENGPDVPGIWKPVNIIVMGNEIERIRRIPREIYEKGIAITWPAIADKIGNNVGTDQNVFRHVLQNNYFMVYIKEYDLKVITGLPFATYDFLLNCGEFKYDYPSIKSALSTINLWNILVRLSPSSMIRLRAKYGYFLFRNAFDNVAGKAQSRRDISIVFARSARIISKNVSEINKKLGSYNSCLLSSKIELDDDCLESISSLLVDISEVVISNCDEVLAESVRKETSMVSSTGKLIAIFVALDEERELLCERWNLKGSYHDQMFKGQLNESNIILYSAGDMGRVPAAVATMHFLQNLERLPDMLIVTGIAGGFAREGCNLGDIIIATSIADLASRKILTSDEKITKYQIRPKEFKTDSRIGAFVKTEFNLQEFEQTVLKDERWPAGRRPTIRYGSLASIDEVISNDEWVNTLCDAWPKLHGIEMEAGGVCAAATVFNLQVAVIRGVSDLADPMKSDTEWRRRAMGTVAHFLERLNYKTILKSVHEENA